MVGKDRSWGVQVSTRRAVLCMIALVRVCHGDAYAAQMPMKYNAVSDGSVRQPACTVDVCSVRSGMANGVILDRCTAATILI